MKILTFAPLAVLCLLALASSAQGYAYDFFYFVQQVNVLRRFFWYFFREFKYAAHSKKLEISSIHSATQG